MTKLSWQMVGESNARGICDTTVDDETHMEHLVWIPHDVPISTVTCSHLRDAQRDDVLKDLGAHVNPEILK
jgi:hypothetical protein